MEQRYQPWMNQAKCLGMGNELFFLERGEKAGAAQNICAECNVKRDCEEYASDTSSEYGIWAGKVRTREPMRVVAASIADIEVQNDQEVKVKPLSFSATAMQTFIDCPAGYRAAMIEKAQQPSGSAAGLGTACHIACEAWVRDGWYLKYPDGDWGTMKGLYDEAYWSVFSDVKRYAEGAKLVKEWMNRQDFSDRIVISTELKQSFMLPTSAGEIPFNYIMDRADLRNTGEYEVIDYKTLFQPVQPSELKAKLQARSYALAMQMEHPEAERIWVTFDMLRYAAVGVVFTKAENRATWLYIRRIAEAILASDGIEETINDGCRWCIRKTICATLNNHATHGGTMALADPIIAAEHYLRINNQIAGLKNAANDLEKVVLAHMKDNELTEFETPNVEVKASISSRRHMDPTQLAPIIGPILMAKYSDIKVGQIDEMMKAENLTDDQCSQIRQLFTRTFGEPSISVKTKSPF